MPGIFISYRREDSQGLAGRLFDRLAQRFGKERVFRDIDAIDPGAKFAEVIAERMGDCDTLVALIGKGWLDAKDDKGRRRLDLPNDFVKAEIAEALTQNKLVIPVLIEGTPMPTRDTLPPEIAALVDYNALPISDSRFDFDIGRLVSAVGKVVADRGRGRAPTGSIRTRLIVVGVAVVVTVVGAVIAMYESVSKRVAPPEATVAPNKASSDADHGEGKLDLTTLGKVFDDFRKYLRSVGYSAASNAVPLDIRTEMPEGRFAYYDPEKRVIALASKFAADPDLLFHEYMHYVLLDGSDATDDPTMYTYFAIESGLAAYFPCSYQGKSTLMELTAQMSGGSFSGIDLRQKRSLKWTYRSFGDAMNEGGDRWGAAFWEIRKYLGQVVTDKLLAQAWKNTGVEELRSNRGEAFVRKLIEAAQESPQANDKTRIRQIFSNRDLAV